MILLYYTRVCVCARVSVHVYENVHYYETRSEN